MSNDICQMCKLAPTRDQAYVCDICGDKATRDLRDLADWLEPELENSITGTQGVQYRAGGGSTGSNDVGLRVNWHVANLKAQLMRALVAAAWHCDRAHVRHSSPYLGPPRGAIAAHAEWLLWRVDGLCLDPQGPRHLAKVINLAERARNSVDRPADHVYLGTCEACKVGPVHAIPGELMAPCGRCPEEYPAEARRRRLLDELDDRMLTAAEIADMARLYLGHPDREKVRKRLNQWVRRRKVLPAHGPWLEGAEPTRPRFRFGDVRPLLALPEISAKVTDETTRSQSLNQWISPGQGGAPSTQEASA